MRKSRTQKRTVVRDAQGKHVHLERLDDTPEALQPDALQQHLHQLLQHYCETDQEDVEEEEEEEEVDDEKEEERSFDWAAASNDFLPTFSTEAFSGECFLKSRCSRTSSCCPGWLLD